MTEPSNVPPPDSPEAITERVEAALAELVQGIDPEASPIEQADAVAARLLAAGARGTRGNGHLCPMAVYLRQRTRVPVEAAVSEWWALTGTAAGPMPPAVAAFIDRFDDGSEGRYSELLPSKPEQAEEG